jgi:hypothetical protein
MTSVLVKREFWRNFAYGFAGCASVLSLPWILSTAAHAAVDLGPIVANAIDLSQMVLLGLAGWLTTYGVKFLSSRVHLQDTQVETLLAQRLNEALAYGINLAAAAARKKAMEQGRLEIEIDNPFIEIAGRYVMTTMPETLAKFGWTAETLTRAIITRAQAVLPAAIPPGTVPVTAPAVDLVHAEGAVSAALKSSSGV